MPLTRHLEHLEDKKRLRILGGVARRGLNYRRRRVVVITLSLLALLAVPLLGVVRMDLWAGHHVLLGESVDFITGFKGIVVAIGLLWGVTFASNVFFGRFFCGWGCPVGYVSRLGEDVEQLGKDRLKRLFHHLKGAGFVGTFIASVMLWWVDPLVLVEGSWTARGVTLGIFAVLTFGGFLHAFLWRFRFCLEVCPIGLYYRYVTSQAPIGIVLKDAPNPCTDCMACVNICPVKIDPRRLGEELPALDGDPESGTRYGDAECIRCGDCVEACRLVFTKHEDPLQPLRFGRVQDDEDAAATADGTPPSPPSRKSG